MSITDAGGVLLPGPACTEARYGLLSVAEVEDLAETTGHWMAGFSHDVESCEDLLAIALNCTPPEETPENKSESLDGVDTENGNPFTLVAGYSCSLGGRPVEDAWDFADRRLQRGEARSLERVFWTGVDDFANPIHESLGQNPDVVDLTPGGGAVPITDGVSMLESWAGENMPCAPILHAQRGLATYMSERNLLLPEGNSMRLLGTGSRLAVGGGYQSSGPMGVVAAAGESWIFVTGGVKVIRSASFFTPPRDPPAAAINRATNDIEVFAERTYGFMLDCGVAAVRVLNVSCCAGIV